MFIVKWKINNLTKWQIYLWNVRFFINEQVLYCIVVKKVCQGLRDTNERYKLFWDLFDIVLLNKSYTSMCGPICYQVYFVYWRSTGLWKLMKPNSLLFHFLKTKINETKVIAVSFLKDKQIFWSQLFDIHQKTHA